MKILILNIVICFNLFVFAQNWTNKDTTTTILLTFSEPIQQSGLTKSCFSVIDSATSQYYKIYEVGLPLSQNNAVVLICERISYKKTAIITVNCVKDTSGNEILPNSKFYYYHSGINRNMQKPNLR